MNNKIPPSRPLPGFSPREGRVVRVNVMAAGGEPSRVRAGDSADLGLGSFPSGLPSPALVRLVS
jgi:hypothetical protein